ncbi:uncharacterized protein LOC118424818 isoform X2 [Branchiostoma floridae]|uniref:Uncharacterized protein LOC118424818 isoform X1 n=1 Tax=Branchiostoma floridae TaxID=7739 RepID=A0A9J7N4M4_BRAFL|nr:uncharacterized protein LOC118424818 isoform X1 [Branchiostoma floridae]XP_035689509.1 uncharacterized protein LOC118424818 isoform X2 [Branchiostoma floridae]
MMKFNCNLCKEDLKSTTLAARRSHLLTMHQIRKSDESFFTARVVQDYADEDANDAETKRKVGVKRKQVSPASSKHYSSDRQDKAVRLHCLLCSVKLNEFAVMKTHLLKKHRITDSYEFYFTSEDLTADGRHNMTTEKKLRMELEERRSMPIRTLLSSYFPTPGETQKTAPSDCQPFVTFSVTAPNAPVESGVSPVPLGVGPSLLSRLPSRMTSEFRSAYQVYQCTLCSSQYRYFASILEHMQSQHCLSYNAIYQHR